MRSVLTATCGGALVAAAFLLALPVSADAASFDCRKASGQRERAVCSDPALGQADEELAKVFRAVLDQLSPEGQRILRSGQASWLRYADEACAHPRAGEGTARECLEVLYRERIGHVAGAARSAGPFVIGMAEKFAVVPVRKDGRVVGVYRMHVMWPRIDGDDSPAARAWNAAAEKQFSNDLGECAPPKADSSWPDVGGECSSETTVVGATGSQVSVSTYGWDISDGEAHGHSLRSASSLTVDERPRVLAAADLFLPGGGWERAVTAHAEEWLLDPANEDPIGDDRETAREVAGSRSLTDLALSPEGLVTVHDVGRYLPGPRAITTPWDRLRRYLKPGVELPR